MRKYAILALCSFCLFFSVSSWAGENEYIRTKSDLSATNTPGSGISNKDLRDWLESVKPAAGSEQPHVAKMIPVNYWQQTVSRSKRRNH